MTPAPRALVLLLSALTLAALVPSQRSHASSAISTREPGLVCDRTQQLCYDRDGISLPATAQNFGRYGEDQARRLIRKGERGRTFLLSNGVACDVTVRTCWDDGWERKNLSKAMTRHLFGSPISGSGSGSGYGSGSGSGYGSGSGSPGWNDGWSGGNNGYTAQCQLRRGGRSVFQGNCELLEQSNGREQRFIATMRNGPRYVFQNRGGTISISDSSGGSWPVQFRDYGRAAVFRWADMSLETRQGVYGGSSNDRNRTLEELLRQLFN